MILLKFLNLKKQKKMQSKNINFEDYKAMRGINASLLKSFVESERLGVFEMTKPKEKTQALINGSFFHDKINAIITGNNAVLKKFANFQALEKEKFGDNPNRRLKEYQDWKKNLPEFDYYDENIETAVKTLIETDIFKYLITNAVSETTLKNIYEVQDLHAPEAVHKIELKGRTDILKPDKMLIVDWKTIADLPSKNNVKKAIYKYNYKLQAAFYSLLTFLEYGEYFDFLFVFVQTSEPYEIGLYQFNAYDLKSYAETFLTDLILSVHKILLGENAKFLYQNMQNEFNPLGAFFD